MTTAPVRGPLARVLLCNILVATPIHTKRRVRICVCLPSPSAPPTLPLAEYSHHYILPEIAAPGGHVHYFVSTHVCSVCGQELNRLPIRIHFASARARP